MKCILNIQNDIVRSRLTDDLQSLSINVEQSNKTSIELFLTVICNGEYQMVVIDNVVAPSLKDVQDIKIEKDTIEHVLYMTPDEDEGTPFPHITIINELGDMYKQWLHRFRKSDSLQCELPMEFPIAEGSIPLSQKEEIIEDSDIQSKNDMPINPKPKQSQLRNEVITPQNEKLIEKVKKIKRKYEPPFYQSRLDHHKCVGVWSPETTGVTTFIENFAIFLAKLKFPIAVLEGITPKQTLELLLSEYNKGRSSSWRSLGSYMMMDNIEVEQIGWSYEGVDWFPFGLHAHDHRYDWDAETIAIYMNALRFYEILLIDFPSRDMSMETLEAVTHVDELWIMVNNRTRVFKQYKHFIQEELIKKRGITCKLLFNGATAQSDPCLLKDYLEVPLLGILPGFDSEIRTYNDRSKVKPLLFHPRISERMQQAYLDVAKEAFIEEKAQALFEQIKIKPTLWRRCVQKIIPSRNKQDALHLKMINTTEQDG